MANTYSFQDVTATLAGAVVIELGYGSANSEEGIEWQYNNSRNKMTVGADGEVMHTLSCDKSGVVKVRLLEISPVNSKLTSAFELLQLSSSAWGQAVITIRNHANDTTIVCRGVAFQGMPGDVYGKDAAMKEWVFDCSKIDVKRGTYDN